MALGNAMFPAGVSGKFVAKIDNAGRMQASAEKPSCAAGEEKEEPTGFEPVTYRTAADCSTTEL